MANFSARVRTYVQALAANNVQVAGFKVANEWDWTCFNTDFPMGGDADAATLSAFVSKYAELLQAVQAIVNESYPAGKRPPVGTFGMANASADRSQGILQGLSDVDGANVLSSVDFVGQHLYGTLDVDDQILKQSWELSGKPAWVTEWGVSASAGWERYAAMEAFLGMLADDVAYQPQVALVFDWDSVFYDEATHTVVTPEATIFDVYP